MTGRGGDSWGRRINVNLIKREIEHLLGLDHAEAERFWAAIATNKPPAFPLDPTSNPTPPSGPIPIPYPNVAQANNQADVAGQVISKPHVLDISKHACCVVLAVAAGEEWAGQTWNLWAALRPALAQDSLTQAAVKQALQQMAQTRSGR